MRWDPNAKDRYVYEGYDQSDSPSHALDCLSALRDDRNPVDDYLHQELDLEDPEKEDEEQDWDPIESLAPGLLTRHRRHTYVGPNMPSRNNQPMMPMARLATISPHTM